MAVPEQTPYSEHTGNGVTKSFALNFDCESKDHLIVLVDEIEPPIATWSLSDGNVVFTTAPASGSKITLQRNTPFSRTTDYQTFNNSFRPQTVNGDFDRLWLKLQELGVANWLMKQYVDKKDDELKAYLMEEIRKQGVALDQLDEYYNYLMERLAQIAVDKGWDASFVVDGDRNQREINSHQKELNAFQSDIINFEVHNTPEKYGADKDSADNTAALQAWLDSSETLHIRPFKSYKFSGTLNLNIANQSIIGLTHNTYGNSRLLYTGTGKAIKSTKNIGYLKLNDMQIVGAVTTENAIFDTGTMGLDLTLGGTIEAYGLFLNGFETLVLSAGTSFYNKFINCRLSDFKEGLKNFAAYNLNIHFCRFYRFTDALLTNGGAGPTNIKHNSFECFNGSIHRSNNDKCELTFHDNYVEVFDKIALPVNFTVAANQTKGNYFGGNMLFRGYYGRLSLRGNKLSIGGAFRLGAFSACDHLESVGNGISLYASGNNLGLLFSSAGTYKSVNVNDFYNASLPGSGGYTQTYARSSFNNISDLRNPYIYYDCILDAMQPLVNRTVNFPSLLNGWVISTASGGTTVKAIANPDGSTTLVGSITGTAKTGNVILNIPTANRPTEVGSTQTYILLNTKSQNGTGGDVVLRYYYTTGDMEIFVEPTNLANILINLTIPQRV